MEVYPMRVVNKLSVGAALFGSLVLAFAGAAQAHDDWDHGRYWDHGWHRGHERVIERRVVEERPVYVARPVVVERPVMMAPPPVVYAPPMYSNPGPASMNLNFNIPLQ
jgi:hypothetical protein